MYSLNLCTKPIIFLIGTNIFTVNTKLRLVEFIRRVLVYNHISSTINIVTIYNMVVYV